MTRPMELAVRLGWYVMKNKAARHKKFPLVTMLEPLEACNLACEGCGRIREYEGSSSRMLSPWNSGMQAARTVRGLLVVSIAGASRLSPPDRLDSRRIVAPKRFSICARTPADGRV